jgi:hypothetical protein
MRYSHVPLPASGEPEEITTDRDFIARRHLIASMIQSLGKEAEEELPLLDLSRPAGTERWISSHQSLATQLATHGSLEEQCSVRAPWCRNQPDVPTHLRYDQFHTDIPDPCFWSYEAFKMGQNRNSALEERMRMRRRNQQAAEERMRRRNQQAAEKRMRKYREKVGLTLEERLQYREKVRLTLEERLEEEEKEMLACLKRPIEITYVSATDMLGT